MRGDRAVRDDKPAHPRVMTPLRPTPTQDENVGLWLLYQVSRGDDGRCEQILING